MNKPAIVLLPGLNNTAAVFDDLVRDLDGKADIFAPTLPPLDSVEALAAHVLAAAPAHFHLVGFSFGAYVAMAMLERAPERVDALCLIGAGPGGDAPERRPVREAAIGKARDDYFGMVSAQASAAFHPDSLGNQALMTARAAMVRSYGAERFISHTTAAMNRPDRTHLIARLTKPLLLIAGETDPLAPPADLERTGATARHKTIHIIPGAGHLAPMEQPARVARCIESWIRT